MGSMGTEAGGTLSSAESCATPTTCAARPPGMETVGQTDWRSAGWWPSRHHSCLCICPPVRSSFIPHGAPPGGCTQQHNHGWLLCELVPPSYEKCKGGENHVSPSTRHRDEEMHLIPMHGWAGSSSLYLYSLYLYLAGREEMGRKSRESKPRGKKTAIGNLDVRYWPWKDWAGEGKT